MLRLSILRSCLLLLLASGALAGVRHAGIELQTNTETARDQLEPDTSADSQGNLVVVWASQAQDGSGFGVYARLIGAAGAPLGREFQVNVATIGDQLSPAVAHDPAGGFVVVWQAESPGAAGWHIVGRRFDPGGEPLGSEFRVDGPASGAHRYPRVATLEQDRFVVVWDSADQGGSERDVFGRLFGAAAPLGDEFQINQQSRDLQWTPAVAAAPGGSFAVAWSSLGQDGDGSGIIARRFSRDGTPLGAEFVVNSDTLGQQVEPALGIAGDGSLIVAWAGRASEADAAQWDIRARRFQPDARPIGPEFVVNSHTPMYQVQPDVAVAPDGGFVIVWDSRFDQDGSLTGSFGQAFDRSGQPTGPEFQANSHTEGYQQDSAVAALPRDASFVVVWSSRDQDGDGDGVFAQRFAPPRGAVLRAAGAPGGERPHAPDAATDLYLPEHSAGEVDPEAGVLADSGRPLVLYGVDASGEVVKLVKTVDGRIRILY